jgi:hypothetical protein
VVRVYAYPAAVDLRCYAEPSVMRSCAAAPLDSDEDGRR